MQAYLDANAKWPLQLEMFEQEVCGMQPTIFPGRLVVADEGTGEYVHLDMYRTGQLHHLRISVTRDVLRIYAQKLLEAANRDLP